MSLPRRDIVPVDPARNVAEEDPPSRPGAQHQPPQASMDGSQLVQWLSYKQAIWLVISSIMSER